MKYLKIFVSTVQMEEKREIYDLKIENGLLWECLYVLSPFLSVGGREPAFPMPVCSFLPCMSFSNNRQKITAE